MSVAERGCVSDRLTAPDVTEEIVEALSAEESAELIEVDCHLRNALHLGLLAVARPVDAVSGSWTQTATSLSAS